MKACVVDDDFTSRTLMRDYLNDMGWDVLLFNHPDGTPEPDNKTLPDALSQDDINLLVMDVRFGKDAEGVFKGLKETKKLAEKGHLSSRCKVIFISQFGKDIDEFEKVKKTLDEKGIENWWLDKPLDFVELDGIIQQVPEN